MITSLFKRTIALCSRRATAVCQADVETVQRIREMADERKADSDDTLCQLVRELRSAAQAVDSFGEFDLVPALALATEAARRALGIRLYDVQLLAGLVLARGSIAQVQTGEGKTYVAALPTFCFALAGRGVHVMTTNGYLAQRDFELLLPMYRLLGVSAGWLRAGASTDEKRAQYACDLTYGPGYEFGFDFLRDQLTRLTDRPGLGDTVRERLRGPAAAAQPLQRGHAFAVIDEADSVMIDEATTPLLLNQGTPPCPAEAAAYRLADELAARLTSGASFEIDAARRAVRVTEQGRAQVSAAANKVAARDLRRPWLDYVEQALAARWCYRKDVDYVVQDGKVCLVDPHTGRIHEDRSWRHGLHQAIEAAEGVAITSESPSLARISRQRYLRLYERLCGMTGTAAGSESEFRQEYRLSVVTIPTHRPPQRRDLPTRTFADRPTKFVAIAADVLRLQQKGQPVLVGAPTIAQSEEVARYLTAVGATFRLLNGKQDAGEAAIVAQAGERGAVTIATNMAGRGTDIKLDAAVAALGGLHVIVAEPNFSARVDRQLIGRAARQGDAGSSQLFVSAEDELIVKFAPSLTRRIKRLAGPSGEIAGDFSEAIRRLQRHAEAAAAHGRRQQSLHDDWLEELVGSLPGGRTSHA